jgi:hypothetical protein
MAFALRVKASGLLLSCEAIVESRLICWHQHFQTRPYWDEQSASGQPRSAMNPSDLG